MSYPRHRVGDIVRLAKGAKCGTPMTVIGLTPDNEVIAQYGTNPDRESLRHPERAHSTYTRILSMFSPGHRIQPPKVADVAAV